MVYSWECSQHFSFVVFFSLEVFLEQVGDDFI